MENKMYEEKKPIHMKFRSTRKTVYERNRAISYGANGKRLHVIEESRQPTYEKQDGSVHVNQRSLIEKISSQIHMNKHEIPSEKSCTKYDISEISRGIDDHCNNNSHTHATAQYIIAFANKNHPIFDQSDFQWEVGNGKTLFSHSYHRNCFTKWFAGSPCT